jgi:hypothetical protein
MRRYLYVGLGVVSALAILAPMVPADAGVVSVHVISVVERGDPAVTVDAQLLADLRTGSDVTFTLGMQPLICTTSTLDAKVLANPPKPGRATFGVNWTYTHCKGFEAGFHFQGVTTPNLPEKMTLSDSAGHPVTVSGKGKTMPVAFRLNFQGPGISCTYTAATLTGSESNTGNSIKLGPQGLNLATPSASFCPPTAQLGSLTWAPWQDSSVAGHPKVVVN